MFEVILFSLIINLIVRKLIARLIDNPGLEDYDSHISLFDSEKAKWVNMNLNKNILRLFITLLFLGMLAFLLNNGRPNTAPIKEPFTAENDFLNITLEDVFEDNLKSLLIFSKPAINSVINSIIILFYIPITYYFIKRLTNSNLVPRLPPII